jgi:hypothetical protein
MKLSRIRAERRVGYHIHDLAMFDDVVPIGYRGSKPKVLLDQESRVPALLDPSDGFSNLLYNDGRQSFGRLVEQQEACTGS